MSLAYYTMDDLRLGRGGFLRKGWTIRQRPELGEALEHYRGIPITKLPQGFRDFGFGDVFGMESGVTMSFLVVLVLIPFFYHMRWGTYVTALGGNPEALKRSGVSTGRYRISVFALMGALAALAGAAIAALVDVSLLRRPFGLFLLYAGGTLLFSRGKARPGDEATAKKEEK